jgi:uncharacterized RDD family membrane protein YckC
LSQLKISGFWRRIVAFFIDTLLLAICGLAAGLFLFDFFARLGLWGRLIGFGVALAYFTLLNSRWGKGKTVGKRIMGIEVVDSSGEYIPMGRSLVRYVILGVPFFLNGIPVGVVHSPIGYLVGFLVLGLGGAIVYLYVFNRRTRQSLHDLAVGTFVVSGKVPGEFTAESVWRPHLVIAGAWCMAVIGFAFATPLLMKNATLADLVTVQRKLQTSGKVNSATVFVGTNWTYVNGAQQKNSYFQSTAMWKERPSDYAAAAKEMASIILANYPGIQEKDFVDITVSYGYDIGIAHGWVRQRYRQTPQQWAAP